MFEQDENSFPGRDSALLSRRRWSRMVPIVASVSMVVLASAFARAYQSRDSKEAVVPQAKKALDTQPVVVKRSGPRPDAKRPNPIGSRGFFTGTVSVDRMFPAAEPSRMSVSSVTFEPGARTAWHSHPLGQTLIVTDGTGWVQGWGGPVQEIRPGDVVRIPPNQKHWHGATATKGMTPSPSWSISTAGP
jgi:quercetin dioxygenase-like cupin family protein